MLIFSAKKDGYEYKRYAYNENYVVFSQMITHYIILINLNYIYLQILQHQRAPHSLSFYGDMVVE